MTKGNIGLEPQVPRWELFEHKLESSKDYDNPFTDVELTVILRNEKRELFIRGFYDGQEEGRGVWKFRFSPMEEGQWSYTTRSNDPDLDGKKGEFRCTIPISQGGLVVNPKYPHYFFRQDSSPQFLLNDGWPYHPGFFNKSEWDCPPFGQYSEEEMNKFIRLLSDHRVNILFPIEQLYLRQKKITDPSFWPYPVLDKDNWKFDTTRFNLEYFQRLDRTLELSRKNEIFFVITLFYDNALLAWDHCPWNAKNGGWHDTSHGSPKKKVFDLTNEKYRRNLMAYLHYYVARTSGYWNVAYCIGSEPRYFAKEREMAWCRYWLSILQQEDPHRRPVTSGDSSYEVRGLPENHYVLGQAHYEAKNLRLYAAELNAYGEHLWNDKDHQKPFFIAEMDRFSNNKYDAERLSFWVGFVSGFHMGRVDRHYKILEGEEWFESKLFEYEGVPKTYKYMKILREFIDTKEVKFWTMVPRDDLIGSPEGVYCLANPGEEYVLYFVDKNMVTLVVPEGRYTLQPFNPRTGEYGPEAEVLGTRVLITSSDDKDWVFRVART